MVCAENNNVEYVLNRDIVEMLRSDSTIFGKGNLNYASMLKAVKDCAHMLNIMIIDQKSAVIIHKCKCGDQELWRQARKSM